MNVAYTMNEREKIVEDVLECLRGHPEGLRGGDI
jgi:hypothetical protein